MSNHAHDMTASMQLHYDGPGTVRANQLFTATWRITLRETLQAGARLVLAARHTSDLAEAQESDPSAENFVRVRGPGRWQLGPARDDKRHPWNRGISLTLISGCLPAGEALSVILGDRSMGSPGYRCQSFAESRFVLRLGVDPSGRNDWAVLPAEACPAITITGNEEVTTRIVVSRPTRRDNRLCVHLKPEDAYGNLASTSCGDISLLLEKSLPLTRARVEPSHAAQVALPLPQNDAWRRVIAATDDGRCWAQSNPFGPSPVPGCELFFGEIHGQSGLCDGTNSPVELYQYARESAGLDFAAVTSHDFELTAKDWRQIQDAARQAHRPGEFVSFLAVEWSGQTRVGGDNNIYFLSDDAPLVRSAPVGGYRAWDPAEGEVRESHDLAQVIRQLDGHPFMVVPHCGGRCCNLDFFDPRVMPMLEIHSCHRTYEEVAQQALRRGLRVGFIGGSDDHRGALGDSHPAARERFFSSHNGLVAVYARELTRASLWEAFFARRVYATNGPRIVLTTRIGAVFMGGEVAAAAGTTVSLSLWTRLDGLLDRIELMRGDVLMQTFYGKGNQVEEFSATIDLPVLHEPQAYYVRVFQTDGGRAWSSPIWVVPV